MAQTLSWAKMTDDQKKIITVMKIVRSDEQAKDCGRITWWTTESREEIIWQGSALLYC